MVYKYNYFSFFIAIRRRRPRTSHAPFLICIRADQYHSNQRKKTTKVAPPTPHRTPFGPWSSWIGFDTSKYGVPKKEETDANGTNSKLTSARACMEKLSCWKMRLSFCVTRWKASQVSSSQLRTVEKLLLTRSIKFWTRFFKLLTCSLEEIKILLRYSSPSWTLVECFEPEPKRL